MQEVVVEESRTCREGEVEEPQRVEKARSNHATVCGDCQAPLGGRARTQLHHPARLFPGRREVPAVALPPPVPPLVYRRTARTRACGHMDQYVEHRQSCLRVGCPRYDSVLRGLL